MLTLDQRRLRYSKNPVSEVPYDRGGAAGIAPFV